MKKKVEIRKATQVMVVNTKTKKKTKFDSIRQAALSLNMYPPHLHKYVTGKIGQPAVLKERNLVVKIITG